MTSNSHGWFAYWGHPRRSCENRSKAFYISPFDQDGYEESRLYYVFLSHPGENLSYPEAAEPFASGTVECQVSLFSTCRAFEERNYSAFTFPRAAFLNEDGSFVRDRDDRVWDGMHNGVNSTECISGGPCTEEILWRKIVATDSTSNAPDTVEVHVYQDYNETSADYYAADRTDVYPMRHHLDYLKLGCWMTSAPGGPWEYGGAFYAARPDYSIAIDSTTRGIRGTATYDGRTVGLVTLSGSGGGSRLIGGYTGRVTLVADFGATHETGNAFIISGRVEELSAVSRTTNHEIAVFSSFDLGLIDGDVAGGVIRTSQGAISTGPDDLNDDYLSATGELAGTWDISFHGKANRTPIPGTNQYFHRALPVVAGNIRTEGTWQQDSHLAVRDVTYDGVFGAYKTNETHD